jgi:23S rRNA (adenine2503-C2)-methyltransferase
MVWDRTEIIQSSDANVKKYVFTKADAVAEAVLYKYPTYVDRTVICCSTQSGCPVGCRFCGAGDAFVRSLTTEEIVSQPARLLEDTGINPAAMGRLQIMFMSMGEPLLNLKNLIPALHQLHIWYPNAALLISTIGPDVDYSSLMLAAQQIPTVGLQFSVHESTDEARDRLIPFRGKLPLARIAAKGNDFWQNTGRSPFFNYCVHEGNNTDADADRLATLFDYMWWQATISVICERDEHVAAANVRQRELAEDFEKKLQRRGFRTRMFDPAGQDDIGGGCGQLWYVQEWMRSNPDKARPSVGSGLPVIHTPPCHKVQEATRIDSFEEAVQAIQNRFPMVDFDVKARVL